MQILVLVCNRLGQLEVFLGFLNYSRTVLFKLLVIVEPLIYFRVCHGTPLTKI